MGSSKVIIQSLEEVTSTTILAFEKIKELHQDIKAESQSLKSFQANIADSQTDSRKFQQKYKDAENEKEDLAKENERLKVLVEQLRSQNSLNESSAAEAIRAVESKNLLVVQLETKCSHLESAAMEKDDLIKTNRALLEFATMEKDDLIKMNRARLEFAAREKEELIRTSYAYLDSVVREKDDLFRMNSERLESIIKEKEYLSKTNCERLNSVVMEKVDLIKAKDDLIKTKDELRESQKTQIEELNAELSKYRKLSKQYSKVVNNVSPQAVNNVRLVKKYPVIEARYNKLLTTVEKVEKERDYLSSKLATVSESPKARTTSTQTSAIGNDGTARRTVMTTQPSSPLPSQTRLLQNQSRILSNFIPTPSNRNTSSFLSSNRNIPTLNYTSSPKQSPSPNRLLPSARQIEVNRVREHSHDNILIKRSTSQEINIMPERKKQKTQN